MDLKTAKNEKEIDEDPYLLLGYGVNSYFDILASLSIMFACITIFCIPVMYVYS